MINVPTDEVPTIYVVDDDASIRESLSSLIRSAGMTVEVFDSPMAFLACPSLRDFACAVIDVRMPEMDGLELHQRLVRRGTNMAVIFITGHGEVPLAVRAMKAGAIDFLNKPFNDTDLLQAIDSALRRLRASRVAGSELESIRRRYDSLTPREKQILTAASQGKANKCIAMDLNVTESTVKVHRHNAMLKMKLRSVAELSRAMERLKK